MSIPELEVIPGIVVEIQLWDNPMPPKDISQCLGVTAKTALLKGESNEKLVKKIMATID